MYTNLKNGGGQVYFPLSRSSYFKEFQFLWASCFGSRFLMLVTIYPNSHIAKYPRVQYWLFLSQWRRRHFSSSPALRSLFVCSTRGIWNRRFQIRKRSIRFQMARAARPSGFLRSRWSISHLSAFFDILNFRRFGISFTVDWNEM